MAKTLILLATVTLLGCFEHQGLFIHRGCNDAEIDAIYSAVDKLNAAFGSEELMVEGIVDVPVFKYDEYDVIACVGSRESFTNPLYVGEYRKGDIGVLRRDSTSSFEHTVMHELGHYVGAWHVSDPDSVMYAYYSPVMEYSAVDIAEFKARN